MEGLFVIDLHLARVGGGFLKVGKRQFTFLQ